VGGWVGGWGEWGGGGGPLWGRGVGGWVGGRVGGWVGGWVGGTLRPAAPPATTAQPAPNPPTATPPATQPPINPPARPPAHLSARSLRAPHPLHQQRASVRAAQPQHGHARAREHRPVAGLARRSTQGGAFAGQCCYKCVYGAVGVPDNVYNTASPAQWRPAGRSSRRRVPAHAAARTCLASSAAPRMVVTG
jgi:hypothetical protein